MDEPQLNNAPAAAIAATNPKQRFSMGLTLPPAGKVNWMPLTLILDETAAALALPVSKLAAEPAQKFKLVPTVWQTRS